MTAPLRSDTHAAPAEEQVLVKSPLLLALAALTWAQQFPQQVAILRQINHVNDDGSYTYGYEAADGSFKIETRDVTGTVRGMFGFVDESGRQRRVSYTAGNTTGFQTTGEPPSDTSPTPQPPRLMPEHPVLRPVRPLPTAPSGHRDSVAKLIRHLGIIGAKQAGSHRFLYASEGSSTTIASPVATTTTTTADSKREEDQPTTRRPTVVQRIVRTRPRSDSRKFEPNPSHSRKQGETSTVASTTEKQGEVDVKAEATPSPLDTLQKRPVVALKVTESPGSPQFVILPSRLLRWRPEEHNGKTNAEREGGRPEPLIRQRLLNVPVSKDSFRYRLRPLPREQLAAPQTPLQIFAQKSELPHNFQDQQFLPQKNVFAFLSSTPRPRLAQARALPVSVQQGNRQERFPQAYDLSESPNGIARVIINDGNYTPKSQQIPHYLTQPPMYYQQRPLPYNADPNRYDSSYYPKPNSYPPSVQPYPVYGQRGLIELLLAYLQHQPKSSPHQGEYTNHLPYDSRAIVPRPHYAQENAGFQPPAILIPYPAPPEQFHIPINNVAPVPSNYELARIFDQRPLLSPALIRQPIDIQNRLQRPPIYGGGIHLPYMKDKDNVYPVGLYIDPRNLNFRQGVALRPAPLQLQPVFVETPRSHATPHPLDYSIPPSRQGPAVSVTTVSPRSVIQTPPNSENQGLPYGFTKKFRSVEVIAPETDTPAQKNSKDD
ncbi:uncharacterized protein [Hetaerina americana]|uniref:uncharacterized protein n=1 Tax=Hetaerina americana TaxID=62018 RepID=UPI003A7F2463